MSQFGPGRIRDMVLKEGRKEGDSQLLDKYSKYVCGKGARECSFRRDKMDGMKFEWMEDVHTQTRIASMFHYVMYKVE